MGRNFCTVMVRSQKKKQAKAEEKNLCFCVFTSYFFNFILYFYLGIFHVLTLQVYYKSICDLSVEKKPNAGKTIITEMGYHPANDADNLVTRKLSASKPLELKASVLHTLLLTNGASVKKSAKAYRVFK